MKVLVVLAAFAAMGFAAQIECKSYKDMLSSEGCYTGKSSFEDGVFRATRIFKDGKDFADINRYSDGSIDSVIYSRLWGVYTKDKIICSGKDECAKMGYK